MKLKLFAFGLVLGLSSIGYAKFHCTVAKFEAPQKGDGVYTFNVTEICNVGKELDLKKVKNSFLQTLKKNGTVLVTDESLNFSGLRGMGLVFKENPVETKHGSIVVTSNVKLVGNEDKVIYSAKSTNLEFPEGGYVDLTKKADLDITYANVGQGTTFTITKSSSVKKPFIAPGFEKGVEEGIEKEIDRIVAIHEKMVSTL